MAAATDRTNADSRQNIPIGAPPAPKDVQGSDNPIPLSPQWLLPKPGESKLGIVTGEPHSAPHHANTPDAVRAFGNGDDSHNAEKKRDVFRPSLYDSETGRRDRWRDEERETNSATRRDRWRETERELGDARKTERWLENTTRNSGEARRAPSERWADSAGRENNHDQRRENKWNNRWGPDDKESERREKWSDSGRDFDGSRERGPSNLTIHVKDMTGQVKDADKEGEHYSRTWRSNSSLARGRGDTSHLQPLAPNKQAHMFGSGRGKGENVPSVFSAGRGRVNSNTSSVNNGPSRSYPLGFVQERSDGVLGDPSILRYSRMKLLDVYRMNDVKSLRMSLEGFIEVPSLTVGEPLEPLALSAPTSEELVTLKGIDKGDIVSSGVPQVSKDGSTGKNSTDSSTSKHFRLGGREDSTSITGDCKDESTDKMKGDQPSYLESPSYEKYLHPHGYDTNMSSSQTFHPYQENKFIPEAVRSDATIKNAADIGTKEVSTLGRTSSHNSIPWRSPSSGERSHESSRDFQDFPTQARARSSEMGWLHSQKVLETDQKDGLVSSSYFRDESQWKNDLHSELRRDSMIQRQSSEVLDQGKDGTVSHVHGDPFISRDKLSAGKFPPYPSPEEMTLFYKDPHGRIQGPFSGSDLIGWFEAGYFGIDLQVRVAGAPADAPFSLLGDVMPHLRAKAIPPPGFGVAKPNDIMEVLNRGNFNSLGNAHSAIGELTAVQNAQRNRHEAATDAENRFIESLMSGNLSKSSSGHYSLPEGMQGYGGPTMGGDSMKDMNYLLAQRVSLERQRSIPTSVPTSLPYWPGRDTSSMVSKSDIIPESPSPQSKFLPPMGEVPRQVPQQVDFLSLLQAAADKSPSPAVNTALPAWSSFPELRPLNNLVHGGMDITKDRIDLQQNQHINSQTGFGAQQQRLHQQNQPSLTQILTQPGDLSSGVVPPEKLLASEISQDPQMLNLLHQQYLMSQIQLQSQTPLPTQLSLLDKYLLLKQQQQKQEQQQQQQLLLQQQHLLSQVLSGHQSPQHFGDPSFGHLKASVPAGNASVDHHGLRQLYETLQNNQQLPVLSSLDGRSSTTTTNIHAPLDVSYTVSRGPAPPQLPNEMFDHNIQPKELDPNLHQESKCHSNFVPKADLPISDTSFLSETMQNNAQEVFLEQKSTAELDDNGKQNNQSAISYASTGENMASFSSESIDCPVSAEGTQAVDMISSVSNQVDDMKISSDSIREASVAKTVKDVEMREVKKPSEKKSKKQKNPKTKPVSDIGKGSSKITDNQQQLKPDFETEKANIGGRKGMEESTYSGSLKTGAGHSVACSAEPLDSPPAPVMSYTHISDHEAGTLEKKGEHGEVGMLSKNSQTTSSHRAWKPAPGLKPKSFLEIQLEEQHRFQREATVPDSSAPVNLPSLPAPLVGLVANSDNQPGKDFAQSSSSTQIVSGSAEYPAISSKNRKSQLHDLLAEEVLAKSKEEHAAFLDEKLSSLQSFPEASFQADVSSVVDDFVEAKDTKKSRRKGAKAKAAGLKASPPVASVHLSTPPVSTEKSKSTYQVQQAKELLSLPPAGPSLGDFVFWKGDQTNSSPAPAWSSDSAKSKKATSLREIQKEQEERNPSVQQQIPIPTPTKVQSNQVNRGHGSSWPVPGSSPSKAESPNQTKVGSHSSSQSRSRTEDDLFWGPLDQAKAKQSDFPSLANPNGGGGKSTPVKGAPGNSLARQKSSSGRAADHNISTSPITTQSFSKGKKDAGSKHSEAMDFRDWCEGELVKLTGSDDTSFLEFCMKQSASEAEMLLRENLGSLDRNHEFIDKFLNYKDFLAPDVIEMSFRAQSSRKKSSGDSLGSSNSGIIMERDADGGGGKKKGKKGKKVSPLVLGFNVVSNRIMMGEIQSIED